MNTTSFEIGGMAGHEEFILAAMNNPWIAGTNEACIACYTDVNVSFTMQNSEYMSFDAGMKNVNRFGGAV